MDWKQMITGARSALLVIPFFILLVVTVAILSYVAFFIGGSLEESAESTNFSTEIETAFTDTTTNLISNVGLVQSPLTLFGSLIAVILVIAIFAGFLYWRGRGKGKGGEGGGMGY